MSILTRWRDSQDQYGLKLRAHLSWALVGVSVCSVAEWHLRLLSNYFGVPSSGEKGEEMH